MLVTFMGHILNVDEEGVIQLPNKVVDFVAWKIFWYVYQELKTIRINNGYNTDPFPTIVYDEAQNSGYKNTILLRTASDNTSDHFVGDGTAPRVHQELHMVINGMIKVDENEIPTQQMMALEQDVRTVVHESAAGFRAAIGRGGVLRFGECNHSTIDLSSQKQAEFVLEFFYRYPQKKPW